MTPRLQLRPLPATGTPPFGTAFLPDVGPAGVGVDLAPWDYVEEEFELHGAAGLWRRTATPGAPERAGDPRPFTTRMLVRRPRDATRASRTVQLEPLHPHRDGGLTWRGTARHLLRSGDAWVGVTVYAHQAELLRDRIAPDRYGTLALPAPGVEWDVLAAAAEAIASGAVPGLVAARTILSGWSATGSVTRVFVREGFAARAGTIDAAVVFISSGGAGEAGYPRLSPDDPPLPLDDARRTLAGSGIPVFEVLSETESETHEHQTRPDSDDPGDRYRLYQVAGTAHEEPWLRGVLTNSRMLEAAGIPAPDAAEVLEEFSDGRLDLVAQAALARMTEWLEGTPPPTADRFGFTGDQVGENRPLARDADGNALGGVRTPWVEAPLAAYAPHGTPRSATPAEHEIWGARLTGTMRRFPPDLVRARHGDLAGYRAAFERATTRLEEQGLLLPEGAAELRASVDERWHAATGD